MNFDSDSKELISILVMMGVLFVLAIVAVALFIRQWRKERRK